MTEGKRQFIGRSTLSHPATSPYTYALTSDSGSCGEADSFWLIETGDTNSRMTLAHATPRFVQSYPAGVKAL